LTRFRNRFIVKKREELNSAKNEQQHTSQLLVTQFIRLNRRNNDSKHKNYSDGI
jgi:hypothetical protein